MTQSINAVCGAIILLCVFTAVIVWSEDQPEMTTWMLRAATAIVTVLCALVIAWLYFRKDSEKDYLRSLTGTYFNRDGFCFAFLVAEKQGNAYLDAYFQSQYDRPLLGRIALRPARGFMMNRAKFTAITFEVNCPPGGFGFTRVPFPIPTELQGRHQSFEVGASVSYPEGKGHRVRFHEGTFLRTNSSFGNSFGTTLTIAGAVAGTLVLSKPATMTIQLPSDVSEDLPEDFDSETKLLWQIGKAPLLEIQVAD